MHDHEREHREALRRRALLRERSYRRSLRTRELLRVLGLFEDGAVRLPALEVRPREW